MIYFAQKLDKSYIMPELSVIVPELLYLGDLEAAQNYGKLQELCITHAINCTALNHPGVLDGIGSITTMLIRVGDSSRSEIAKHLGPCQEFVCNAIESNPKARILVFCHAGRSRSATVCLSLLIAGISSYVKPMTLNDAWFTVREARPIVYPNPQFRCVLRTLERDIHGQVSLTESKMLVQCIMGAGLTLRSVDREFTRCEVLEALRAAEEKEDPEYAALYALRISDQKKRKNEIIARRAKHTKKIARKV